MAMQMEIPSDHRVGGFVKDLGLDLDPKLLADPVAMGDELVRRSLRPGASELVLPFHPRGPVFVEPPLALGGGGGAGRSGAPPRTPRGTPAPGDKTPILDPGRLLASRSVTCGADDVSRPGLPTWVLDDPRTRSHGIYKGLRRMRKGESDSERD
jgi:hypothetical protein